MTNGVTNGPSDDVVITQKLAWLLAKANHTCNKADMREFLEEAKQEGYLLDYAETESGFEIVPVYPLTKIGVDIKLEGVEEPEPQPGLTPGEAHELFVKTMNDKGRLCED